MNRTHIQTIISVIIVTYRSEKYISDCLRSIDKSSKFAKVSLEYIIVINDPNNKYQFPKNYEVIVNPKNMGFAKAVNRGSQKAKGKYLLIINPDTIMEPDTITVLLKNIGNEKAGIVVPKITDGKNQLLFTINNELNLINTFIEQLYLHKFFTKLFKHPQAEIREYEYSHNVHSAFGTCMLVSAKLFRKLKGFDERFFLFLEDIDLCKRVRNLGYKIIYTPDAKIIHFNHKSSTGFISGRLYRDSLWKYFRKWKSLSTSVLLILIVYLGSFLRLILWKIRTLINKRSNSYCETNFKTGFYKGIINI